MDVSSSFKTRLDFMNNLAKGKVDIQGMEKRLYEMKHAPIPPAADKKKKYDRSVVVSGVTKKEDVKHFIKLLQSKINEIAQGDEDLKIKQAKINMLQQKLNGLEKILGEQKKAEASQNVEKAKRKIKDRVVLHKDDLNSADKSTSPEAGAGAIAAPNIGGNLDVMAEGIAAGAEGEAASIDVEA